MKTSLLSICSVAFVLVLAAPRESAGADKIRVGYGSMSVHYAPIWIAGDAQLYQKNGLDAEVLYLESALVRSALIAGEIAMGGMSATTMAAPRLQGADTVMVASFLNTLQYRLVVRPEIKSVADLKKKRVGVAGFGLGAHRGAQILLAKLGLNPDTDVVMLQTGGEPTRVAALVTGSIDATVLNPPAHNRAAEAGMRILANMAEMNFPYLASSLVTTESFVKKNPDVARRVVKSVIDSIHVLKTNPELSKRTVRKYMRLKENRDVDEAYQIIRDVTQRKPYPTLEGLKGVMDELSVKMPAAKTVNLQDFMDIRFIEEFDRSGYIDRLYQ
jgi:ABC-type nitrate/sulfonate/bicarbonate transport system substrate-binding protein